jgi:phage terminase large subunit GpA-like protein
MGFDAENHFAVALQDVCSGFEAFRPPRRVTVAEGAADALVIKQPGGYTGPWSAEEAPYMVEPMNMLASRRHEAVVFVGPARTGKTMGLLDGWISYAVTCDPGDMLVVQMTQDKAREFSKTRVDRALRYSPKLNALKAASSQADNTHDKQFRHGMWLRIGWPTVSQLSSSDYRYVGFTDYDRMPDDIDGEGAAFGLGLKRTQTFLSRGMCMVESSPGREIVDPNWHPITAHEAPPTSGVLGIYNRSDRRRWYWKCHDCAGWFEAAPGLSLFRLPSDDDLIEIVREADLDVLSNDYNRIFCPLCDTPIGPRSKHKLNLGGRWLADGQALTHDDEVIGTPTTSTIAGYWMGGVAATYQSWKSLVMRHLQGLREYALSGSELALQNTVNTDQGMPYLSRIMVEAARNGTGPQDRAEKDMQRYLVPDEARFLVAAVDVQGGVNSRFVVQVHAIGPHLEQWVVDRYNITESMREGMGTEKAPIDPASYAEDWNTLTERVVRSTYRTSTEGVELRVKLVVVDSGGEDGVTDKAYAWFRRLRREGLHKRVMLVKGASAKGAPLIKESWVGNRNTKEKGDVPLYLLNPNMLKDAVSTGLRRALPGPGYIHLPAWLPKAFFDELQAEVRQANGTWQQIRKRNEAFDLAAYVRAGILRLGAEKIRRWENAPVWARPIAENSEAMTRTERRDMKADEPVEVVAEQAQAAPTRVVVRRQRRTASSSYLG